MWEVRCEARVDIVTTSLYTISQAGDHHYKLPATANNIYTSSVRSEVGFRSEKK